MILAIIVGFVTGWLISMPIGPVNAVAISRTLYRNYKHGIAVGIGAALMDLLYCAGAARIHAFLLESPLINLIFQCTGFVALLYLGLKTLFSNKLTNQVLAPESNPEQEVEAVKQMQRFHIKMTGVLSSFAIGIILYASNVAAVPEWIFITALWRGYGLLEVGWIPDLSFALGAGLGTAGWFLTLVKFISHRKRGFAPKTLRIINLSTGVAMVGFGLYFLGVVIFKTDWPRIQQYFI